MVITNKTNKHFKYSKKNYVNFFMLNLGCFDQFIIIVWSTGFCELYPSQVRKLDT